MRTVKQFLSVGLFLGFFLGPSVFSEPLDKGEFYTKILDGVLANPKTYQKYENELKELFVEDISRERKVAAAKLTTPFGFPPAIQFLLKELKIPQELAVPEVNRKKYAEVAQILGSSVTENPSIWTPELRSEIRALLASKDPAHSAAQNDLNRVLPPKVLTELDEEITELRQDPSNQDPCLVMCRVSKALAAEITDQFVIRQDGYVESEQGKSAFDLAVRNLLAEFLLKANEAGCEIPNIREKTKKLLLDSHDALESNPTPSILLGESGLGEEAIKKAQDFLSRISSNSPENGPSIYFLLQSHRLADALVKLEWASTDKSIQEFHRQIHERIATIIRKRTELTRGEGGSLVTTYGLAAIGASMPEESEIQKKVAQILLEKKEELKPGEGFPYNFAKEGRVDSERGRAGRSVVAELAIYKGGGIEQRLKNADSLLLSLTQYDRYFRDVFSGIGLNRTHDLDDPDLLAPYYGPSSIPYVFEALSVLEQEKELSSEQKEQLKKLRSSLEKKILGMFEPNGLFQPQYQQYYFASKYYDNALTGLALENACKYRRAQSNHPNALESKQRVSQINSDEKHH